MHSRIVRSGFVTVALSVFLNATSAYAEMLKFKAIMYAAQEVPPNESKGQGTADLTYDTTGKNLTWTITFDGLTGPATVAHFHDPAEAGKNAGVALLIGQKPTSNTVLKLGLAVALGNSLFRIVAGGTLAVMLVAAALSIVLR